MTVEAAQEEALAVVLRVANTESALAWYQRLGFRMEYEHSSGPALKDTMAVITRGKLALILSDREEVGRSNVLIYMKVTDLAPIANEFGLTPQRLFSGEQLELHDPDANRIRIITSDITPRRGRLIGPS